MMSYGEQSKRCKQIVKPSQSESESRKERILVEAPGRTCAKQGRKCSWGIIFSWLGNNVFNDPEF